MVLMKKNSRTTVCFRPGSKSSTIEESIKFYITKMFVLLHELPNITVY